MPKYEIVTLCKDCCEYIMESEDVLCLHCAKKLEFIIDKQEDTISTLQLKLEKAKKKEATNAKA